MTAQKNFFSSKYRVNYGQQGHHLFCGGRGQIAAAFGEKISLENLEQQMLFKATEENTFLETSKRREVIKFFALKH